MRKSPSSAEGFGASREALIGAILEFLGHQDLLALADIRRALEREIDLAGSPGLLALKERLSLEPGWAYYPPDPLARNIHHRLADKFLSPGSELLGAEHLANLNGVPIALLANHLSYADANVIEVLLHRSGFEQLSSRLTAVAGPKVFTDRHRRFSSLCFGTVKVPQSTEVASGEAVLSAREVAAAARRAIEIAHERLRQGDALLLFGEGTRSRTSGMQAMLPAVARYLEVQDTMVLPVALTGAEELFGIEDSSPRAARVVMRIGRPLPAKVLLALAGRDRRRLTDAIALTIAELLPKGYRGVYTDVTGFPEASGVLRACRYWQ